jgi:hypothetical protein
MIDIAMSTVGVASALDMLEDLSPDGGSVTYTVGTNVEYASYVEYGTYRMAAQPYLRPAAREVQGNISQHLDGASSIDAAIKSAALEVEAAAKRRCPVDTGTLRASISTTRAD